MSNRKSHPKPPPIFKQMVLQLRQLRSSSARNRSGTYYIEGVRLVQQALQAGAQIALAVATRVILYAIFDQQQPRNRSQS